MLGLLKAADMIISSWLERSSLWKQGWQEPRERILWDPRCDGSRVVIVGDSVLSSYYVNHPRQALWARLSARLGVPVFPAVLNAASPEDIRLIARRVASLWPPGTVALVGVHPARVFAPGAPQPSAGHYATRLVGRTFLLEGQLRSLASQQLLVVRRYDRLREYLQGELKSEEEYYGTGIHRDRRWNDGHSLARERFDALEKTFENDGNRMVVSFEWIRLLHRELSNAGIHPIFVLTPLNHALLEDFVGPNQIVPRTLSVSRTFLLEQLRAASLDYLDLYSLLDSESFADLIHPNARGDDRIAEAISQSAVIRRVVHE